MNNNKQAHFYILGMMFILMLILHRYIFLQGDDYGYGTFIMNGFDAFADKMVEHYYYVNGRTIVHVLVCGLLVYGVELFRILGPVLITASVGAAAFMPRAFGSGKNSLYATVVIVCLFSVMSILITNQSIYWLDGSMNYLYPILLMLLTYYFIRKSRTTGKTYVFLPVLGFFAGCSVEQTGTMVVGLLLLDLIYRRFFEKIKLTKIEIITFIATLAGYALVITAPGNFERVGAETDMAMSGIMRAAAFPLMNINFLLHPATLFNAAICLCSISWLVRYKSAANRALAYILGIGLVAYEYFTSVYFLTPYYVMTDFFKVSAAMLLFSAINICALLYTSVLILKREKESAPLFFTIVALGAQFMMLFSPVFSYRTLVPTIFAYFVIIAYTIYKSEKLLPFLSATAFTVAVYFAPRFRYIAVFAVLLLLLNAMPQMARKYKKILKAANLLPAALCVFIGIMALLGVYKNIEGYKKNSYAHIYNIEATAQYKKSNERSEKLILKKVPDEKYHWSAPYISEYHMYCFKLYHGILDTDVEFVD